MFENSTEEKEREERRDGWGEMHVEFVICRPSFTKHYQGR
jgi:hypothetical protein